MKERDWLSVPIEKVGQELMDIAMREHRGSDGALRDFMERAIKAFDVHDIPKYENYEAYCNGVREKMGEYGHVFFRWMYDVNRSITGGDVCDFFGHMYEVMFQGKCKATALGQFFTPMSIAELMAAVAGGVDSDGYVVRVSDPCCGSGRTLLGHFANEMRKGRTDSHRYVYIGEDIDLDSCRMTALNMMAHCMYGAVVKHDVLMNDVPSVVYLVNESQVPLFNPTMSIRELTGDDAKRWWENGGLERMGEAYGKPLRKPLGTGEKPSEGTEGTVTEAEPPQECEGGAGTEMEMVEVNLKGEWKQLNLFDLE